MTHPTNYFLINLNDENPREISDVDFILRSKYVGGLNGSVFIFDKTMSRTGVARLMILGWSMCDMDKNLITDFFDIINNCPIQFYAE